MYNNCNDRFDKVKKRIEKEREGYKIYYIPGPRGERGLQGIQGERGLQGPSTIKVGSTETIDSSEDAVVTNVGTDSDLILNFKIPRGEKGDTAWYNKSFIFLNGKVPYDFYIS